MLNILIIKVKVKILFEQSAYLISIKVDLSASFK